jgi:hypothetical protein
VNGRFSRCAAAHIFSLTRHFQRRERTQHEKRIHRMDWNLPFPAIDRQVGFSAFHDLGSVYDGTVKGI